MTLLRAIPRIFWQVISRQAAKAIMIQSFPPAFFNIFALNPKPTQRKNRFWQRSFIMVASKEIDTIPKPLMAEIKIEKIMPETTGAGIAYFLNAADFETRARPRKITMAAKPRVHRYSNLNEAQRENF